MKVSVQSLREARGTADPGGARPGLRLNADSSMTLLNSLKSMTQSGLNRMSSAKMANWTLSTFRALFFKNPFLHRCLVKNM